MKLLILLFARLLCALAFQCKDEDGQPVDWFVAYKLPESDASHRSASGFAYMYMTPKKTEWVISEKSIQSNDSILGHTLENFFKRKPSGFWLSYNDQPAKGSEATYGHTKGVINADKNGGFWMIHSVPHFPNKENFTYEYPKTAQRYGQSILCVNFKASEIDKIGLLLTYNEAYVWEKNTPDSLTKLYPHLYSVVKHVVSKTPSYITQNLTSASGFKFEAFAKSSLFGKDLYELVANTLQTDLYAETWRNEPRPLPASCSTQYKIMNINSMNVDKNFTFSSHADHSKLAVSADSSNPFVCIGDINRAEPQERRGGGTVCFKSKKHWLSYFNLISSEDSCRTFYKI